ncbi:MAG: CDP-diacylglycerol--glycerol-3-phosphate 3-phosphatidyltransferase [Bacilli bacterium]
MKMNLPNKLTLVRFLLALITVILLVLPWSSMGVTPVVIPTAGFSVIDLVCCLFFIIASITDAVDGHIARSRNLVTDFGKFMDPLADKFLVNASLIALAVIKPDMIPAIVVVLFIGRDLAVDGLRFIAASKGEVIAANKWGKAKTIAQMIAIPFIFVNGFPFNYLLGGYTYIVPLVFICIALCLSLISGGIYIYSGKKFIIGSNKNE